MSTRRHDPNGGETSLLAGPQRACILLLRPLRPSGCGPERREGALQIRLPFVHHNTIGRGNRTIVDGPVSRWLDADRFQVYVQSRTDDGRPPLKPEEVDVSDHTFWLGFIFPNLWQNHISEDVRVVAAFVPVNEEHTLLYLRFYQRFLPAPVLGDLVARWAMPFNVIVAHQDRRVVQTQRPKPSVLRRDEQLV